MKQLKIVTMLLLCSILYACPDNENGHRNIAFVNKSGKYIECQAFWSGHITNADTLFQCRVGSIPIPIDSLFYFSSLNDSWETDFNAIPFLQFLIMDAETFGYYANLVDWHIRDNCDTIRNNVPILHRYQLTLEDLQRMNWTVVYPPEQ
ncbi:MAG: hypothetical protein LBO74_11775 [Candidatus Symbiothrix sp.]|jgi:hypothetical protein|nr:hypothetical protein [Candidatus Symbiothrix sp.]